jgi:hypothetical protein
LHTAILPALPQVFFTFNLSDVQSGSCVVFMAITKKLRRREPQLELHHL